MRRAEWMTVLRYGHLRSAPVVVDAGKTQGVGTAYTPCNAVVLHAPKQGASSMALCLSDVESQLPSLPWLSSVCVKSGCVLLDD